MNSIKAIFLDFDWTLFDHKTRAFNEKGIEALRKAHDKGIKLIINSARSYHSLRGLGTFERLPLGGFVVSNGGAAFTDKEVLYADYLKRDDVSSLLKILDERGIGYILITLRDAFIKVRDEKIAHDFYKVFYEPLPFEISKYQGEDVLAIQIFAYEKDDVWLKPFCDEHGLYFNRFAENNVEISSIEFLKSKGIKKMYDHLSLKKEETMAFGDDLNDIPMFQIVKYGICLGNGKEEAKKAAYYVTDTIERNGLYKALQHFGVVE